MSSEKGKNQQLLGQKKPFKMENFGPAPYLTLTLNTPLLRDCVGWIS